MVLQDSFLFDGTIRENVAFSKPDATEEEIDRACAIARVDEIAERYELEYDAYWGAWSEAFRRPRERVSIARAILADPRVADSRRSYIEGELGVGVDLAGPDVPDDRSDDLCHCSPPVNYSARGSDSSGQRQGKWFREETIDPLSTSFLTAIMSFIANSMAWTAMLLACYGRG